MALPNDLDKCAYYSPLPMLLLSRDRLVSDFNLAARVLWGINLITARGQPVATFLDRLSGRLQGRRPRLLAAPHRAPSGEFDDAWNSTDVVSYVSARFGRIDLLCMAVRLVDPECDDGAGFAVFLEITSVERLDEFRETFLTERDRQVVWEEYAVSYDRILPLMPYYQEVLRRHMAAMESSDVVRVVEIGAGTGNVVVPLLQAGRRVTAVDTSRAMLDRLRGKVNGPLRNQLIILEQDAEYLPQMSAASCDGASILLALFDMNDPRRALEETIRILRPGGTLVITEPKVQFQMEPILDFVKQHLVAKGCYEELKRDIERVFRANWKINPATRAGGSPLRAELLVELLSLHGFRAISVADSHFGNCATIKAVKP